MKMLVWCVIILILGIYAGNVAGLKMITSKFENLHGASSFIFVIPIYIAVFPVLVILDRGMHTKKKLIILFGYFLYPQKHILFTKILAKCLAAKSESRDKRMSTIRSPEIKRQVSRQIAAYACA